MSVLMPAFIAAFAMARSCRALVVALSVVLSIALAGPAVSLAAVLTGPVQTGTCTMGTPASPGCVASGVGGRIQTVTLTRAVNPGRTFVVCQNRVGSSNESRRVTCDLTTPTTLVIQSSFQDTGETVRWYVLEFYSGVQVQRGLATLPAAGATSLTLNVTLPTAVNPGKTFVLTTERMTTGGSTVVDERWTARARLTSTTNLELARNEATAAALTVAWQVIQMDFASVQSGLSTIIAGQTAVAAAISAVDPAKTFLVLTRRAAAASNGIEGQYQVRGELTNGTTLTFTRAQNTNAVDISWFAVSLKGGSSVQRGVDTSGTLAASATRNVALANAITINQSVPFISTSGGIGANNDLDDTSWTTFLSTLTNLQLQRAGNNAISASTAWFVVDFNRVTTIVDWQEIYPP